MTRLLAPAASFAAGSLLFPVEIPGLDDIPHEPAVTSGASHSHRSRAGGRRGKCDVWDLEELTTWQTTAASARLLVDVRTIKRQGNAEDASVLAQCLRDMGYDAFRVAQNASNSTPSALKLAHDFVVVQGVGSSAPLVVEPNFREHFCIGSVYATERYRQLLAAVPEELVAPYAKLQEMVKLICAEMKFSFEATGNSLPPWRSTLSVLSRWAAAAAL